MLCVLHNFLQTLLSQSHYQQQDLNSIKDDLSALKFGFAILENSDDKQSAELSFLHHQTEKIKRPGKPDWVASHVDNISETLHTIKHWLEKIPSIHVEEGTG